MLSAALARSVGGRILASGAACSSCRHLAPAAVSATALRGTSTLPAVVDARSQQQGNSRFPLVLVPPQSCLEGSLVQLRWRGSDLIQVPSVKRQEQTQDRKSALVSPASSCQDGLEGVLWDSKVRQSVSDLPFLALKETLT